MVCLACSELIDILMGTQQHHLRMASLVDLANFVTKANYGDELEVVLDQIAVNLLSSKMTS